MFVLKRVTTWLALPAAIIVAVAIAASAGATNPANSNKPYSLVICAPGQTCTSTNPAVVGPASGSSVNPTPATMTATLTNNNKSGSGIQLGSDNLNVPATPSGFSVTDVPSLPACPTPLPQQGPACWYSLNGGSTVGLRNLNLSSGGGTNTVTMSVATPTVHHHFALQLE
jgi:hypothetical protein